MNNLVTRYRLKYLVALVIMLLLLTMTTGLTLYLLDQQKQAARVINVAGMQRMLSQKAALHLEYVIIMRERNVTADRQALGNALQLLRSNHAFLTMRDGEEYLHLNAELYAWYFTQPGDLNNQLNQYLSLLSRTAEQPSLDQIQEIHARSQLLLQDLDHAVLLFEQSANQKIEKLRNLQLLMWLVGLTLLIAEIKWIFFPMERSIASAIERLQQTRLKAEHANQSRAMFLARASHELRTPLQAVLGYLHLYQESQREGYLAQANKAAQQLKALIASVEDYNRLSDEQQPELYFHPARLTDTLGQSIATYRLLAKEKGLDFSYHFSSHTEKIFECDHERLSWVIGQLLDNAVKFTDQGVVTLSAWVEQANPEEDELNWRFYCEVEDSGPGFNMARVNAPPSENNSDGHHFQGLQLGLARCNLLLAIMSGELSFVARQPHGTKALLSVPLKRLPEPEQVHGITRCKVLLVEDNLLNAKIIEKMLESLELTSIHASHGGQAIEVLGHQSFDVILMDLNMPIMDGFKAIKEIRQTLALSTPILVLTANTSEQAIKSAMQLGATDYLFKPVDQEALERALVKILSANDA
ncbi:MULTISPECIES: response regulator [unclassified Pseudoalteromonas]|uniref:response regulator n=1 Tax=unclassified Pseudoalteromonas TaxID=194690 RepID=UPI0020971BB0|nr:response regulator [Pseudoalteromonas sp. XMcav2-N]MCO7190746.1 response regulator [Pseudoalteromonas sp. XMcav2-N]